VRVVNTDGRTRCRRRFEIARGSRAQHGHARSSNTGVERRGVEGGVATSQKWSLVDILGVGGRSGDIGGDGGSGRGIMMLGMSGASTRLEI
jgi:hypothetical protein